MSLDVNKALARRYFEEFLNQGNLCVADEVCHESVAYRSPFVSIDGVDRLKRFFLMIRKAFPDLHYVVEDNVAEANRVVCCFSSRGTYLGGFEGTQLSGRQFSVMGVTVFCVHHARITEVRSFWDIYTQMLQLHWMPPATKNCA